MPRWRQLLEAGKRNAFALLLFLVVAVTQYFVVSFRVVRTIDTDLTASASNVAKLAYDGQEWRPSDFGSGPIAASNWFVVRADGAIFDIDESLPSTFGIVTPPPAATFEAPTTIVSDFKETWRVFAKHLDQGFIALGVRERQETPAVDAILLHDAELYGSTMAQAKSVEEKKTNRDVEVAIVGRDGRLLGAWGGVPLKMVDVQERLPEGVRDVQSGNKTYRQLCILIRSNEGSVVGRVVVHRDITAMRATLQTLLLFDAGLLGLSVFSLLVWAASRVRRPMDIQEALRRGEGPEIEFKASFQWDTIKLERNKDLQREVVKAVAAFLNTDGGDLFIGVTDDKVVCGLEDDLRLMEEKTDKLSRTIGKEDKLLMTISQRLLQDIGPGFAGLWQPRPESIEGRLIIAIAVEPAGSGAWLQEDLYVRSGSLSRPLRGREAAQNLLRF